MMYRILFLACLLFLSTSPASAQPGEWFVFDHTNAPFSEVNPFFDIEVDKLGRMWAVQEAGLFVYSNARWKKYFRSDPPGTGYRTVLEVSASGTVWIGCSENPYGCGIFPVDTTDPIIDVNEEPRSISSLDILSLATSSGDRVWAGLIQPDLGGPAGLAIYDGSAWIIPDHEVDYDNYLSALDADTSDMLWAVAYSACSPDESPCNVFALQRLDNKQWSSIVDLPASEQTSISAELAIDSLGVAWIAIQSGGLFRYADGALSNFNMANSPLPSDSINALHVKGNALWIGTKGGLVKREGDAWTVYDTTNSGLPANNVTAIATDTYGNTWVATYSASDPPDGSSQLAIFQEGGVVLDTEDPSLPASTHRLLPNHPNPFSETTTLSFELTTPADVRLRVFDLLGREVATPVRDVLSTGRHRVPFSATGLSSGVYLVRLEANGRVDTQRIMVLR